MTEFIFLFFHFFNFCNVLVLLAGDLLWESSIQVHNHAPRQEVVEVKQRLRDMKKHVRRSNENTSGIVTNAIATASAAVTAELP